MKRKKILLLSIIISIFIISGCEKKDILTGDSINDKISDNKSVVIYFSATGTTEEIAKRIANQSNSDIIEIIPKQKYTSSDLNYNSDCRANKEQNDDKSRPEIENKIDISKYDNVYLGYPIWWGTYPKIILTLLDTYDFSGKNIIPFCTSGSTDISKSVTDLRNYNQDLNIKDGKRFSVNDSDDVINKFIEDNTNEEIKTMKVIINGKEYIAKLENNETVKDFAKLIPTELQMNELNGNEKYVYLDTKLATDPYNPQKINKGDIMLYGDNCLVIFYKSFDTSYRYTKIGHIDNLSDLGDKNIIVKFDK